MRPRRMVARHRLWGKDFPGSSRAATDDLLDELRAGRWRRASWAQFLAAAVVRSVDQARLRPRALGQTTALHGVFLVLGRGSGQRWVATSWLLTALHLGMLEGRSDLGLANALTLTRANLPVVGRALGPWLGAAAAATDFADGKLARHTRTTTPFGAYADSLADAAVWTWVAFAQDSSRALRTAVVMTWLAPIAVVTAVSLGRARMIDPPRPRRIRPAATLQIVIAARALQRRRQARHAV